MRGSWPCSGGVDSSVAAALMVEAGHDVVGVTLKQWEDADGNLADGGLLHRGRCRGRPAGGGPARHPLLRARLCR